MSPPTNEPGRSCPKCGAVVASDQEYCLECGARVTKAIAPGHTWRKSMLVVGVILVLAGAGVALAYDELSGNSSDNKKVAQTETTTPTFSVPSTTPPPTTTSPGPTTTGTTPLPPGSSTTPPPSGGIPGLPIPIPGLGGGGSDGGSGTSTTPGPVSPPSTSGIESWPAGKTAWTVILYSVSSRSSAESKARSASGKVSGVGVLHSSEFSSLNPGYWVVFVGQYSSKSAAQSRAESLQGQGFSGAYARHVKP